MEQQLNQEQLKQLFHQEMISLYKKINKEVKYRATRLLDLINKYGGYEAAVKYLTTESNVQDFAILWEKERLDLTVEALIVKPVYRQLFLDDIVNHCDKKLKEYSYAPNKIEEEEEESFEEMLKGIFEDMGDETSKQIAEIKAKDFDMYKEYLNISVADWKELFVKTNIFSAKNQDLILRMYLIGDHVEAADLAGEEGYTATYPYKEVVTTLAKRVKAATKVNAPVGNDGKIIWWHMLFNGGFKDNGCFDWSLRPELREAIKALVEEGAISVEGLAVNTQKEIDETLIESSKVEPEQVEKHVEMQASNEETPAPKSETSVQEAAHIEEKPVKAKRQKTPEEILFEQLFGPSDDDADLFGAPEVTEPVKEVEAEPVATPQKEEVSVMQVESVQKEEPTVALKEEVALAVEETTVKADETKEQEEASGIDAIAEKKAACIDYYGAICDLCGFDFGYTYGDAYEGMIEVHHISGDDETINENTDPIKELIPVCCNCHHVMHSQKPPLSVEHMRKIIKA